MLHHQNIMNCIYIYNRGITFPPLGTNASLRVDLETLETVEGPSPARCFYNLCCIISIAVVGYAAQLTFVCFRILRRAPHIRARWADQRCLTHSMVVHVVGIPGAGWKSLNAGLAWERTKARAPVPLSTSPDSLIGRHALFSESTHCKS